MSEENTVGDQAIDEDALHFGWDSVRVYCNIHGDICFSQHNPIFGDDVIVCVPRLYAEQLKWHIDKALRDSEDED